MSKEITLTVNFQLTKNVDDFESVKVQGGIAIPVTIEDEEDYKKQYKHWLGVVRAEVIDETYKYYRIIQSLKQENFTNKNSKNSARDDLKEE